MYHFRILENSPKQGDSASGGGHHRSVIADGVLSGDVVLEEQTFRILLLQSVPLPCVLQHRNTSIERAA